MKVAIDSGILSKSFLLMVILALLVLDGMVSDWGRLTGGFGNLKDFFYQSLWPPDWSVLEPQVYPVCTARYPFEFTCSTAWIGVIETIKIAFVATVFGMALSFPLSLAAARNLSPGWLSFSSRFILSAFRSLPSLIWAIFFVILIGMGPLSGVLAMTVYTVGYLGKLWYEAIEGLNKTPLEAAQAMGLSQYETALGVVVPESANELISHSIFLFEYNFRSGTIIGIVGAGGIGYYIDLYLRFLQYDKVIAYLLIIFLVVLIIDFFSIYARSFFTEDDDLKAPSWFEVIYGLGRVASNPSSLFRGRR